MEDLDMLELEIEYKKAVIEIAKWLPVIMKALPVYQRSIDDLMRAMKHFPTSVRMRPF